MTTEDLLKELQASQTDLARLVERVSREQLPWVTVGTSAVIAWQRREPEAWAKVRAWLAERGVGVARPSAGGPRPMRRDCSIAGPRTNESREIE